MTCTGEIACLPADRHCFARISQAYAELVVESIATLIGEPLSTMGGNHAVHEIEAPTHRSSPPTRLNEPIRVDHATTIRNQPQAIEGTLSVSASPEREQWTPECFVATQECDKQHTKQLNRQTGIYQDIFACAGAAMAVLDPHGIIIECNVEFTTMSGRCREELIGQPFWIISPQGITTDLRSAFSAVASVVQRSHAPITVDRPDQTRMQGRMHLAALARTQQNPIATLLTIIASPQAESPATELRAIERDILCQVAAGATTTAIAKETHLSRQGVDYNLRTLMQRFGAANRAELVARAYTSGTLSPTSWPPAMPSSRTHITGA